MDHDGEAWQFALAGGGALASGGMVKIGTAAVLKSISGTILAGVSAVTPAGWFAIGTIVTVSSVVYFKGKTKSKDEVDPYGRAGQKKQGREVKNKSRRKDNFNSRNNKRNKKPAKPKKHTPMDDHRKYK